MRKLGILEILRKLQTTHKKGITSRKELKSKLKVADLKGESSLAKSEARKNLIRGIADEYGAKNNLNLQHGIKSKVTPEKSAKIAKAYHYMKHDPHNPEVQASYKALADETLDQYKHIKKAGFKFTPMKEGDPNPYPGGSKDLFSDIEKNKHMHFFPTDLGYGSGEGDQSQNNPMLAPTKEKLGGKTLLVNDVFRIVHDMFGHAKEGNSFGPNGEENAWEHHKQMYSPLAQKALTSETRGQNSWVNFGVHGEHNRKNPHETIYAKQKTGLMPDWTMQSNIPATPKEPTKKSAAAGYSMGSMNPMVMEKADKIHGGLAAGKKPSDFNQDSLAQGIKVELEHTSNKQIATEIAMDHLMEDPKYYDKLEIMEKGLKGDWEKEGYTIRHQNLDDNHLYVSAHDKDGTEVGSAKIINPDNNRYIHSDDTKTHIDHQRKGLATAMYQHAEKVTGKKMRPSQNRTIAGRDLWRHGRDADGKTQFGRDSDLSKALPPGKTYIAMDGDNAGSQVERAALKDDVAAIKDISQRITKGSMAIIKLAQKLHPGIEVVVSGGDDLGFLVDGKLTRDQIENLRHVYLKTTGFTITAGYGDTIPQATRAMLYGKITGKNKTVFWNPVLDKRLNMLSRHETPAEKVAGLLDKSYFDKKVNKYKDMHKSKFPWPLEWDHAGIYENTEGMTEDEIGEKVSHEHPGVKHVKIDKRKGDKRHSDEHSFEFDLDNLDKAIEPQKIENPHIGVGIGVGVSATHPQKTTAQKPQQPAMAKSQENLKKAVRNYPPQKQGESSQDGRYIAMRNKIARQLHWHYSPELSKKIDDTIDSHKAAYVQSHPEENRKAVSGFIDKVRNHPTRHFVPAHDNIKQGPSLRARHVAGMLQNGSNYHVHTPDKNTVIFTVHSRHGQRDQRPMQWKYDLQHNTLRPHTPMQKSGIISNMNLEKSLPKQYKGRMLQVVSIIVVSGDKMLFGKRKDNSKWTNPGGKMEDGEAPLKAAIRELKEETNIDPSEIYYLGSNKVDSDDGEIIVHTFAALGKYYPDSRHDPDEEVARWKWFDCKNGIPEKIMSNNQHKNPTYVKYI